MFFRRNTNISYLNNSEILCFTLTQKDRTDQFIYCQNHDIMSSYSNLNGHSSPLDVDNVITHALILAWFHDI
jgi:hypothetical protein